MILATALLTLAGLTPPPLLQDDGPSPERIDAAVAALETAYKDGTSADRIAAIRSAVEVVDKRVIGLVAKGLDEKDAEVGLAALDALGRMHHPSAASALTGHYRKSKKDLLKDEQRLVAVLKAVGRQGHPDGVEVLIDSPFSSKGYPVVQARFYGLGNIRSAKSVEGLFSLLDKVGTRDLDRYMSDIRLALVQLTGEDRGDDSRQWQAWWRENKKGYEVSAEAKPLPIEMRLRWNSYWGIEEKRQGRDG